MQLFFLPRLALSMPDGSPTLGRAVQIWGENKGTSSAGYRYRGVLGDRRGVGWSCRAALIEKVQSTNLHGCQGRGAASFSHLSVEAVCPFLTKMDEKRMARDKASSKGLESNAHLEKVLAPGADNVSILRGFIGRSDRDGYIRLFASLADTSISVEIAEADIVNTGEVLNNHLGKRIVWIKKGARITVTKSHTTEYGIRPRIAVDKDLASVRFRRLSMQVKSAAPRDTCVSVCSCSTCQSHCTDWCGVCICLETAQVADE